MIAFQIRTPIELKRRLVEFAQETGQSQQAVITQALEDYLREQAMPGGDTML